MVIHRQWVGSPCGNMRVFLTSLEAGGAEVSKHCQYQLVSVLGFAGQTFSVTDPQLCNAV